MTQTNRAIRSARVRDFLLYIAISVLLVIAIALYAFHEGKRGNTSGLPVKWLGFAMMTAFVFGNAIRFCMHFWSVRKLWVSLGLLLIFHCIMGLLILSRVAQIGLVHFAIFTPVEYFALIAFLSRLVQTEK